MNDKITTRKCWFNEIELVFDNAKIYPTVVACQPKLARNKSKNRNQKSTK